MQKHLPTIYCSTQWAEYGYIPSALPDAKCFGEGAQVSLPGLH